MITLLICMMSAQPLGFLCRSSGLVVAVNVVICSGSNVCIYFSFNFIRVHAIINILIIYIFLIILLRSTVSFLLIDIAIFNQIFFMHCKLIGHLLCFILKFFKVRCIKFSDLDLTSIWYLRLLKQLKQAFNYSFRTYVVI